MRYYASFVNIYYLEGSYGRAKVYIQKAVKICGETANYTYETQAEFKKHLDELKHIDLRCDARLSGKSALDLRPEDKRIYTDIEAVTTKSDLQPILMMLAFGLGSLPTYFLAAHLMRR